MPQIFRVTDQRLVILSQRNIEATHFVEPKQSIKTSPIKIDQHGRKAWGVALVTMSRPQQTAANRIKPLIPNAVVTSTWVSPMSISETPKTPNDPLGIIPHSQPTSNQIGVVVHQHYTPPTEPPSSIQIKEQRTTSQKRFKIGTKLRWMKTSELSQELPLPSSPLKEGPDRG
tara:strand:+ start:2896 stop:3411 length:516 start_codon:yes stop_codon:yes gene_type:complete